MIERADADPLVVAAACETAIGFIHARQLEAMCQVSQEDPPVFDPTGQLCDPAPAEIASALHWTPSVAGRRLELAMDLCASLPIVLDALRRGEVDLGKAQEIADGTARLAPEHRCDVADRACTFAAGHTRGQLRAWLAREVARIDADAVRRRRREALTHRRVWIAPEPDGMATLGAYLSAEEAQACYLALTAGITTQDGSVDVARADRLVALLTGTETGTPIPVQVIITSDGPELSGYGALSDQHASDLCDGAPRINLQRPDSGTQYRPKPSLIRWVRARDRHCRFPGCRRPAAQCDLDHVVPHPIGPTSESNLACLCRYHHRLKTHTNWRVRAIGGHRLEWTSPRGRIYLTGLDDP
jgi:hypothetical protein